MEQVIEMELLSPEGTQVVVEGVKAPPFVDAFEGKTIGLWWNRKPNGDEFLSRVGDLLAKRFKDIKIVKFWELEPVRTGHPGRIEPELIRYMARNADLVIASNAD